MKQPVFMKDLQVEFVSLVDKAANKKKFAIFKSATVPVSVDGVTESGTVTTASGVKKGMCYPDSMCYPTVGTSFSGVLQEQETQESLCESKEMLDEYFWILKCVLASIVAEPSVSDKSAAMKKAIDEFRSAAVDLFKGMPVAKQAQSPEKGGDGMTVQANGTAPANGTVAKAAASGGAAKEGNSQNGTQEAQNRSTGQPDKIEQVTAAQGGAKMTKAELEVEIQKKKDEKKKQQEAMMKADQELAALEQEVAKAGTDQAAGTGRDTVASNGAAGTVAKTEAAPVKKDGSAEIGATAPTVTPSQALKQDVSLDGAIGPVVESFKKHLDVSMQGVIGTMTDLLKQHDEKVKKMIDEKVTGVQKEVTSLRKTAGLSNAGVADFDTEAERTRDTVAKGDDGEWSKAMDGFGSLKKPAKR